MSSPFPPPQCSPGTSLSISISITQHNNRPVTVLPLIRRHCLLSKAVLASQLPPCFLLLTSYSATLSHPLLLPLLVCSCSPCLSSHLPLPLVSRSHHHLSTIALHYSSAGQCHQTIASRLLPKLLPRHLLSAAIVSSCLQPLPSLMADCQVVVCQQPLPNHPLSSAAKAVIALPLISSRCLLPLVCRYCPLLWLIAMSSCASRCRQTIPIHLPPKTVVTSPLVSSHRLQEGRGGGASDMVSFKNRYTISLSTCCRY
jgi:hypothetical protein